MWRYQKTSPLNWCHLGIQLYRVKNRTQWDDVLLSVRTVFTLHLSFSLLYIWPATLYLSYRVLDTVLSLRPLINFLTIREKPTKKKKNVNYVFNQTRKPSTSSSSSMGLSFSWHLQHFSVTHITLIFTRFHIPSTLLFYLFPVLINSTNHPYSWQLRLIYIWERSQWIVVRWRLHYSSIKSTIPSRTYKPP